MRVLLILLSVLANPCYAAHKNVLMIVVDDLRPQIKAYGEEYMHTPHIDELASNGALFSNAYVQLSICSPTRNSFLSGRMPDKTQTWNFINDFREIGEDWTALPEFFLKHGFYTTGAGKIYHPGKPANFDENRSWSGQKWPGQFSKCDCGGHGWPPQGQASCEGLPPHACQEDNIVEVVVGQLEQAANGTLGDGKQPFFIAAGFHKPHLPFYAPPEYFDLYPNPSPPVPLHVPEDMPYVAWHSCLSRAPGENFSDWGNFTDIPNSMTLEQPMDAETAARLRRGYSASVSYTDANIGKVLAALEPMKATTVVMMIGDHGWSLGEQNVWCKMSNFENGVRVPFIIRAPWLVKSAVKITHMVEAISMYRTLADITGIGATKVEDGVDGISLVPLLQDPSSVPIASTSARSQFPRCYTAIIDNNGTEKLPRLDRTDCQDVPNDKFDFMGYSLRVPGWRLTEWMLWEGASLTARWDLPPNATELYDHRIANGTGASAVSVADPFASETVNVASDPANTQLLARLRAQLRKAFGPAHLPREGWTVRMDSKDGQ